MPATLEWLHERLFRHFGPQHWWPADTPFEVMVGAILTQNTAWSNVEKAIANLRCAGALDLEAMLAARPAQLAEWIRPSGYFNIKAARLQGFCHWYRQQGGYDSLRTLDTATLRHVLLSVHGVGAETADDMLLYAFGRPVFVIDAYTRRLFSRLGLIQGDEGYEALRSMVEETFGRGHRQVRLFNELHALIVAHAKDFCRKRPQCQGCPLTRRCPARQLHGPIICKRQGCNSIRRGWQTVNKAFLQETIGLAEESVHNGGGPFAALVVKDGEVVGRGNNRVTLDNDPTAHAEVQAIRDACRNLGDFSLQGCQLYVSCEPCPMCLSACYWAHLDAVYYAAGAEDAAAVGFDDVLIREELRCGTAERRLPMQQALRSEAQGPFRLWSALEDKIEY